MASIDPQSGLGPRLIEYLPVADQPNVFGKLSPLSVCEIIDESEHELASARIVDESELRSSLREVRGATMVIEDNGVPDEHGDLEDLGELLWWGSVGLEEEGFDEREDGGGELGLHRAIVVALPVEVDGRDGEDRERRTSYRAQGVDRESVQNGRL
jgi:hypothetical protein